MQGAVPTRASSQQFPKYFKWKMKQEWTKLSKKKKHLNELDMLLFAQNKQENET